LQGKRKRQVLLARSKALCGWQLADLAVPLAMGGTLPECRDHSSSPGNESDIQTMAWVKTCTLWLGQLAQQS